MPEREEKIAVRLEPGGEHLVKIDNCFYRIWPSVRSCCRYTGRWKKGLVKNVQTKVDGKSIPRIKEILVQNAKET